MKTRILHTEYWKNMTKNKAPKDVRLLYNYLMTNIYINMCGTYELPDEYIILETGLTAGELKKAQQWLSDKKKAFFYEGWVKVVDADNYNNYQNSPKTQENYRKEIEDIPSSVLDWFNKQMDSSIDTSTILTINNNTEIIKHKERVVKGEFSEIGSVVEEHFEEIAKSYNVPIAFVASKYDDMVNWRDENPRKNTKVNWKATLRNWVKRDAVKIVQDRKKSLSKSAVYTEVAT